MCLGTYLQHHEKNENYKRINLEHSYFYLPLSFLTHERTRGFGYISALWQLINILFLCAFACNEY
jgi:hypothetical protein